MCTEPTTASTFPSDLRPDRMTAEERNAFLRELYPDITNAQLAAIATYDEAAEQPTDRDTLCLFAATARSYGRAGIAARSLSSFRSTDESLAETMQDLMTVMQQKSGKALEPTLLGMLSVGKGCTPVAHAPSGQCILPLADLELGMLPLRGHRLIRRLSIENTALHLALTEPCEPFYPKEAKDGCLLTLLRFTEDHTRLHRLWSSARVRALLRQLVPVRRGTLCATLLDLPLGCVADLSVLTADAQASVTDVTDTACGYLLTADESCTRELLLLIRAEGLEAVTFARLTSEDANLTLMERDTMLTSLPMALLRELGRPEASELEILPRTLAHDAVCNGGGRLSAASNWEKDSVHPAGDPVVMGDAVVLHTTLGLHGDLAPVDVQAALMQCALRLVAAGGRFDSITASIALSVAESDATDALWAMALGWRRAILAWGLPTAEPIVVPTEHESGSLTISLIARAGHIPAEHADCPVCLRLFAVAADDDSGIPRADELRAMLSLTSRALAAGHIVGLRPLWDRPLGEALSTVKDLSPAPGFENITGDERRVYGLLIRSDKALTEGVLLGTLAPVAELDESEIALDVCSLIHRPTPRVLLPVLPGTEAPAELLNAIRRMGAEPHTLAVSATHQGCTALADAILADDIVLLNADAADANALMSHRRVAYALRTRLAEHATLFALRGAAAALEESGLEAALAEANAPDLALRLVSAPEGLERVQLARAIAYYR